MKRILFILLLLLLLPVIPANAAVPIDPPSEVTVPDVMFFRHLAENNDMLCVFERDIAFTADNYSTEYPASTTFEFRLYADNGTLLNSSTPYSFPYFGSYGYGPGIGAFYWSATDEQPTWGDNVTINIHGWPYYFSAEQDYSFSVDPEAYSESTTQEDSREELYNFIMLLADRMESAYTDTGIVLKTSSDIGIVLSTYGEMFFKGSIDGLLNLCPDLFFIQVYIPEKMTVEDYDMSAGANYTTRLDDTDIKEGFEKIEEKIGVSETMAAVLIYLVACVLICVWTIKKGWGIEAGAGIDAIIGVFAALVYGDVLFTLLMVLSLVAAMAIVWIMLLRRS